MSNPTESRTFHLSNEPRPPFDRFQLLVEKAEITWQWEHERLTPKSMHDTSLETRPAFGMTVPPVAERRSKQRI